MSDKIIQLKVTLKNTKPPIWRRIQVKDSINFLELNCIIQLAMGWQNSHLFQFKLKNRKRITIPNPDLDDEIGKPLDPYKTKLKTHLGKVGTRILFEYDFGDSWVHTVLVEKILPPEPENKYPICIAGKMNCPPEDCGGILGFYENLYILFDKKHPEQESTVMWMGEDYDTNYFNIDDTNASIAENLEMYIEAWHE